MMKAGEAVSVLLAHACGLSTGSGCLKHHVCHIYFALYFLLPRCSLDSRDRPEC